MKETLNKLVHSLFQKKSLQECSIEELKLFTEKFPFFATAQLLYTVKLKDSGDIAYKEQLQKTSLYFNNPLWLNYLLNNEKEIQETATHTSESILPDKKNIPFEDYHNDELVIANLKHEIIPAPPGKTEALSKEAGNQEQTEEPQPAFEPYYTVDYFASQGIKPSLDEKPADRFGQQLKSFTEWLKTLKRLPPQEIEKSTDTALEQKVIHLAEDSIENREVITEAMAEVWIKQGETEKAIAIFSKLSLLNPGKSSYFAGLIENLKKQ